MTEVASFDDLALVAKCHSRAFPRSLSVKLGARYTSKMLEWYLNSDDRFLIAELANGKCYGYLGGYVRHGSSRHGSTSSMIQHTFQAAVASILIRPWLWLHPEVLSKLGLIIRNVGYKLGYRPLAKISEMKEPYVSLVVIGVDPSTEGRGIGRELLSTFDAIAKRKGVRLGVLSVKRSNKRAIKFYEKMGWVTSGFQKQSVVMSKSIV